MATAKTISHIGDTKLEVIKDTHDAFKFTVDDKSVSPNSPKTVMYISSESASSDAPTPLSTTGRITMSNTRTEGAMSTNSADVDGDIGIGGKILIREGTGAGTSTRAAIYAEKDASSDNHRLILDPYRQDDDDPSDGNANSGTVYIRGSLIVEGDKTILDTAEHITSENLIGINAIKDSNGTTSGGAATAAGIHVYSGASDTQFLYDFSSNRWRTSEVGAASLNDLEAKHIYVTDLTASATSTLATVDINGGTIDGTAIGAAGASTAKFTTLEVSGTTTLASNVTVGGTLGVSGALTAASGNFSSGTVIAQTFQGSLTGSVTGTCSDISNHTTDDLAEGTTAQYHTTGRVRAAIGLAAGETFLQYDSNSGKFSTNLAAGGIGSLGDVTITTVNDYDILRYDNVTANWVNSDSLTIKNASAANFSNETGSIVTDGGLMIKSTQGLDTSGNNVTEAALICMGGAYIAEDARVGASLVVVQDIEARGINATTFGNIVPVELTSSGGRDSTKTLTSTATSVPLHADISAYYSSKTFAAGQCVVALTDGTDASVAMFSFSKCGSTLTLVLDQEVHSDDTKLQIDYDSSGVLALNVGAGASTATYCVKVLPVMTSDSISNDF